MWPFKNGKKPSGPPALTSQDEQIYELTMRIIDIEDTLVEMSQIIKEQFERIDQNTIALDHNMKSLAALTIRPPTDLLGGSQELN